MGLISMRSEFVRIYKALHSWTGIVTGMALFIAFYAGALTIFKEPLSRWAAPPRAEVAMPLDETQTLIVRTLKAQPEVARDFHLRLKSAGHLSAGVGWQVRPADADEHDTSSARHYVATLDATGAVHIEETHPLRLAEFIDTLHRVVGLPVDNDPNRWVMGVVATLYALALASGVVVLLPSLVKDFFALRVGRNLKRMWVDAHNIVGIITLPFHVVMALTAVIFAWHDGIYFVQDKLIHDGKWASAFQRPGGPPQAAPRDPAAMLPPAELLRRAQAFSPTFEASALQYMQVTGPRAAVRVWGHDPGAHSPRALGGFVGLDPYSGKVTSTDFTPGKQDAANATVASFFALHFGTYGGTPVQWMYFLLGLAGAWLFYSGNLLWVETRRRKQVGDDSAPPVQRRDARLMAAATVGVCLGSVCGILLAIVGGKWLHVLTGDANAWIAPLYYLAFFAAIIWAFLRGAAHAAVHLLWLAAALAFALPLTTLLAWPLSSPGLWIHGGAPTLSVDATALMGGIGFAWLARVAARRARHGPQDSVWSVSAAMPPRKTSRSASG
jgi:uncharacterized iron-regulated membrane protein